MKCCHQHPPRKGNVHRRTSCGNIAKFKVNDKPYCRAHAAEHTFDLVLDGLEGPFDLVPYIERLEE